MTTWPTIRPDHDRRGDGRAGQGGRRGVERQPRVVVAADGSAASVRAAEAVQAAYGDADIVVVTVVDGRQVPDRSRAVEVGEQVQALFDGGIRTVVRVGSPLAEVLRVVADEDADVVAFGAPTGSRTFGRAPTGERLLRRLDCDVLVVAGDDRVVAPPGPQRSDARPARPLSTSPYTSR